MSLTKDIDKTTDNDKSIDADSRNPLYALIGLNDFFLEQGKAVADRAQSRMDTYRDALLDTFTTLRVDLDKAISDGRERANELQKAWTAADTHDLQAGLQEYVNNVVRSYASMAERGERLFHEMAQGLGQNPLVKRVAEVGQGVAKQVEQAADKAEERVRDTVAAVREKTSERLDDTAQQVLETAAKTEELAQKVADKTESQGEPKTETKAAQPQVAAQKAATLDKAEQATIDVDVEKPAPARKTAPRKTVARKTAASKTTVAKAPAKSTAAKRTTTASPVAKPAAAKSSPAKSAAAKPAVTPAASAPKPVEINAEPVTGAATAADVATTKADEAK